MKSIAKMNLEEIQLHSQAILESIAKNKSLLAEGYRIMDRVEYAGLERKGRELSVYHQKLMKLERVKRMENHAERCSTFDTSFIRETKRRVTPETYQEIIAAAQLTSHQEGTAT